MNSSLIALGILITIVWSCTPVPSATAQPQGWPCDYGYRPGNTWFYRSSLWPYWIRETVLRDSIGADGAYWVYISVERSVYEGSTFYDYQLRIDTSCTFGRLENSRSRFYPGWFIAAVNKEDEWAVDSLPGARLYARVRGITESTYFDRPAKATDVFYFQRELNNDSESHSATYAEGIGVVYRWGGMWNVGEYDVLVGAVIDGRHYGNTSSVDEGDETPLRLNLSMLTSANGKDAWTPEGNNLFSP